MVIVVFTYFGPAKDLVQALHAYMATVAHASSHTKDSRKPVTMLELLSTAASS